MSLVQAIDPYFLVNVLYFVRHQIYLSIFLHFGKTSIGRLKTYAIWTTWMSSFLTWAAKDSNLLFMSLYTMSILTLISFVDLCFLWRSCFIRSSNLLSWGAGAMTTWTWTRAWKSLNWGCSRMFPWSKLVHFASPLFSNPCKKILWLWF